MVFVPDLHCRSFRHRIICNEIFFARPKSLRLLLHVTSTSGLPFGPLLHAPAKSSSQTTFYQGHCPSAFKYPPCSASLSPARIASIGFAPSLVGFAPNSTLFMGPRLLSVKPGQNCRFPSASVLCTIRLLFVYRKHLPSLGPVLVRLTHRHHVQRGFGGAVRNLSWRAELV